MPIRVASAGQLTRWGALPLAAALGVAVERQSHSWSDPLRWLPDLVVGLVLIGAAQIAWAHQRSMAALLALAGLLWFLGTLWPPALFLPVAVIVHLLVTAPGARPRSRLDLGAVLAGYGAAVAMPSWRSDAGVVLVAVGLVLVLGLAAVRARGRARQQRLVALGAGAGLSFALIVSAVLRTVVPSGQAVVPALLLHELAVCAVVIGLVRGFGRPPVNLVTDLVVELEETRSGTPRDALARLLGDPNLQIGHLTADGEYLDTGGHRVPLAPSEGGRTATLVERDGNAFAVLVHDTVILDEPALIEALISTTRLTGSNTALRVEVEERMAEVDGSRRRLLLASDEERARLERRLRDGAERRLEALADVLRDAAEAAGPAEHVGHARRELMQTLDDLRALAQGLRPRELDQGLPGALRALARSSPLQIDLTVPDERFDPDVEMTAWFVCAEAVANVVKHAGVAQASIALSRQEDTLVVTVTDDGWGGADLTRGTGIRGLADRLDAVHGLLNIESPAAGGTRVTAALRLGRNTEIPLGRNTG